MFSQLQSWIIHAWQVLNYSNYVIWWNSFLAFIPLGLSIWLFRKSRDRTLVWWLIFGIFVAFLPNAPYVLTDVIHLIKFIRQDFSTWTITLILIPQYFLFIFAGFQSYVISLLNLGYFLKKLKLSKYIIPSEIFSHSLCAFGIYLGRFQRFNSWDIVTNTDSLIGGVIDNLTNKWPIFTMTITFLILTVLYWLMKQVTLGIVLRFSHVLNKQT